MPHAPRKSKYLRKEGPGGGGGLGVRWLCITSILISSFPTGLWVDQEVWSAGGGMEVRLINKIDENKAKVSSIEFTKKSNDMFYEALGLLSEGYLIRSIYHNIKLMGTIDMM